MIFHAVPTFFDFSLRDRRLPAGFCGPLFPQLEEKGLQKRLCLLGAEAPLHRRVVVEGHGEQVGHRAAAARLGVCRTVHHPLDPAVDDGPAAHGAGFQRHEQLTLPQPPAAQLFARRVDGQQLGMVEGV